VITKIKEELYLSESFLDNNDFIKLTKCIEHCSITQRKRVFCSDEQVYYPSGGIRLTCSNFDFSKIYLDKAVNIIEETFKVKIYKEHGVDITAYFPEEGLPYHWDGQPEDRYGGSGELKTPSGYPKRDISTVFYPNSIFTGGDLHFKHLDVTIQPKPNTFVVFPSSELYTHKVEKVTSGIRLTCPSFWSLKE